MTFANAVNGSNLDFQNTSGTMEWATRDRQVYGRAENIGFTYAAGSGTFTVTDATGAALSASNPAYIALSSKTAGALKRIKITANQSFIDDNGSSQIIGNLFGLTTSIAFAQDIPFFLYAVLDDTETTVAFMISRFPNANTSPVAANIGKSGSAVADTQASFFSLANVTVADYESNPCVSLGSFRMRMSSADDWTVQTLAISDGIGQYQEMNQFLMAVNQFGAAASSFYYANGGTAPQFTTNNYVYKVNRNNILTVYTNFNVATTAGVGAVNLQLALPFSVGGTSLGSALLKDNAGNFYVCTTQIPNPAPQNKLETIFANNLASGQLLNNNMTGNALLNHFAYAPIAFI